MQRSIPVLKLPEKNVLFPLVEVYLSLYPIYFELYGPFFTIWISISNFV